MDQDQAPNSIAQRPIPWNKGKLIGAKPPLSPKHVWAIRTKLQVEGQVRDIARCSISQSIGSSVAAMWSP
jgi:hypothetical protein